MNTGWRMWAVIALLAGLIGALAWAVASRASPTDAVPVEPVDVDRVTVPEPSMAPDAPDVEAALVEVLDAWGAFAVTGDLTLLDGLVSPDGPRMCTFQEEARALQADPPGPPDYRVTAGPGRVRIFTPEAITDRTVSFTRPGEADQVFAWRLIFRLEAGRWKLWSVTPAP